MTLVDAIKLCAMRAVVKPDWGSFLRHVFRWYSKTFHTPLHEVDDLPIEDVLTAFYESKYEAMEDHERREEIRDLTESEEQRAERLRIEEEEANALLLLQKMAVEERTKIDEAVAKVPQKIIAPVRPQAEAKLPDVPSSAPILPEIKMSFEDPEAFEKLLNEPFEPEKKK